MLPIPEDNPVMLLANSPVPVPSEVFESEIVGLDNVLQQIPRAVTAAFPSEFILKSSYGIINLVRFSSLISIIPLFIFY